jgi:hypothetical protein
LNRTLLFSLQGTTFSLKTLELKKNTYRITLSFFQRASRYRNNRCLFDHWFYYRQDKILNIFFGCLKKELELHFDVQHCSFLLHICNVSIHINVSTRYFIAVKCKDYFNYKNSPEPFSAGLSSTCRNLNVYMLLASVHRTHKSIYGHYKFKTADPDQWWEFKPQRHLRVNLSVKIPVY